MSKTSRDIVLIGSGIGLALALGAGTVMASGWGGHRFHGGDHAEHLQHMVQEIDLNQDGAISMEEADQFRDARFKAMDVDADGEVTPGEFRNGIQAHHFERLDSNADGVLSRDEYMVGEHHDPGRRAMRRFHRLDQDENGRIDNEEMSHMAGRLFSHLDENEDGIIDADELESVRVRMHR
ncbi:MAG: EF-hand domain-containing protein [Alphaproteobacteria bacterium]